MHPLIASIPDHLLKRSPSAARARQLEQWCSARNFRPTLADIEAERRRRATHTPGAPSAGEQPTAPRKDPA